MPITVVDRLTDGTLILSNGFKVLPSIGTVHGERKKLSEMTAKERQTWQNRLLQNLGESMTDYYNSSVKVM